MGAFVCMLAAAVPSFCPRSMHVREYLYINWTAAFNVPSFVAAAFCFPAFNFAAISAASSAGFGLSLNSPGTLGSSPVAVRAFFPFTFSALFARFTGIKLLNVNPLIKYRRGAQLSRAR